MASTELLGDKGGLKMLAHLQTLTREQCAYSHRDSCNWTDCVFEGGFETCMSEMSELIIVGDNGGIMVLAHYPYKVSGSNVHIQKWDSCK